MHPSHRTRSSDASTFDEICEDCGATDAPSGSLSTPCPLRQHAAPCGDDVAPTIADEVDARVERFNVNRRMDALREYAALFHANAKAKGFAVDGEPRPVPLIVALLHEEVSEMLGSWRRNEPTLWVGDAGKPEGIAAEAADVFIRLLQSCEELGIDLAHAVESKHLWNQGRPWRHGGKKA